MKLTSFKSNKLTCYTKFSVVGEIVQKISSGCLQRLGIAKAHIAKPKLLILDEASSSLDSHVENSITKFIKSLSEISTTIVVAHWLSKVRNLDVEVFLEEWKVLSTDSFKYAKKPLPNFFYKQN